MGDKTAISWCDHTFNPWWGCAKVSAECTNCYAETFDRRVGGSNWGMNAPRRFFGDKHWAKPLAWDAAARAAGVRKRVFCASMADVFEERNDLDEARARLWILIAKTPSLDWLLLTKRPEHMRFAVPWSVEGEPWSNVWLGTTAGTVESLERVAVLRRTPAAVRFVSCEPLLEAIADADWDRALGPHGYGDVHWLIVGDESGPRRRPARVDWVREARDAAARHGVAFHFKQWAGMPGAGISGERTGRVRHLPLLDGVQHAEFPR